MLCTSTFPVPGNAAQRVASAPDLEMLACSVPWRSHCRSAVDWLIRHPYQFYSVTSLLHAPV